MNIPTRKSGIKQFYWPKIFLKLKIPKIGRKVGYFQNREGGFLYINNQESPAEIRRVGMSGNVSYIIVITINENLRWVRKFVYLFERCHEIFWFLNDMRGLLETFTKNEWDFIIMWWYYSSPHEKIDQCLTDINRCLTDIFKI